MGVPDPSKKKEIWGSNPQPKHAIVNCSQTVSGKYKRAIPPIAK